MKREKKCLVYSFSLPLSLPFPPMWLLSSSDWLSACCFSIGCLFSLLFSCVLLSLISAFVVVGRIALDEERSVLLKPVVQFYFT